MQKIQVFYSKPGTNQYFKLTERIVDILHQIEISNNGRTQTTGVFNQTCIKSGNSRVQVHDTQVRVLYNTVESKSTKSQSSPSPIPGASSPAPSSLSLYITSGTLGLGLALEAIFFGLSLELCGLGLGLGLAFLALAL